MDAGSPGELFATDLAQTRITIYMGFVSFTILIWDHLVTLGDEINFIWKGRKGAIVWLFLINRYLSPLGFIINLFAYMSPSWTAERLANSISCITKLITKRSCQHFVRYEGSMTVIGLNIAALMMLLRVYAMYPSNFYVMGVVTAAFIIELTVNAWLLTHGVAVVHNPGIHACTMIFSKDVPAHLASASAWLPLTYDTIVLILTLNRTVKPVRHQAAGKIMTVLLRDGVLYYSVIFSINLVLTLMIARAPAGIQNITAQLEYLLTVAMMSRITLHLKKQGRLHEIIDWDAGGAYTFRGGISSTMHDTRLHFARSHNSDLQRDRTLQSTYSHPTQVTVTVDEVVVRDHGTGLLDLSDDADPRNSSVQDPAKFKKHLEWHELHDLSRNAMPKREPPV